MNWPRHWGTLPTAATLLALTVSARAHAQDEPTEGTTDSTLPVRSVGFIDAAWEACDPVARTRGECVEEVRFVTAPWRDAPRNRFSPRAQRQVVKDAVEKAEKAGEDISTARKLARQDVRDRLHYERRLRQRWKSISRLQLDLVEGMAYRWFRDGDLPQSTIVPAGTTELPDASDLWDRAELGWHRMVAAPEASSWLTPPEWAPSSGPGDQRRSGLFDDVVFLVPNGEHVIGGGQMRDLVSSPPRTALLRGHFSVRLGADGRLHDFDIMDASPVASAPFFEQMYPFRSSPYRPLSAFRLDVSSGVVNRDAPQAWAFQPLPLAPAEERRANQPSQLAQNWWDPFLGAAQWHWDDFYENVAVDIVQFGLEDYTDNHMRVLTALTLMASPPGADEARTGRSSNLVAAARGQTDTSLEVNARIDRAAVVEDGVDLSYLSLPDAIVDSWLDQPALRDRFGAFPVERVNQRIADYFGEFMEEGSQPLLQEDKHSILQWVRVSLKQNPNLARFTPDIRRIILQELVQQLDTQDQGVQARERIETEIFLNHIDLSILEGMDTSLEARQAPADVVAQSAGAWRQTLSSHGYVTRPSAQGLGAIDPTSICTTQDGVEALSEPVIGAATVAQLLVAPSGLDSADAVLAAAWQDAAFLAIDDPTNADLVTASPLVDLPGDRSLYRVQWTVWTGWHVLWLAERTNTGEIRLAARTTAFCDDMVLAPEDVVPTVVRTALLESDLRPVSPALRHEWRDARERLLSQDKAEPNDRDGKTSDEALEEAQAKKDEALAKKEEALAKKEELGALDAQAAAEQAGGATDKLEGGLEKLGSGQDFHSGDWDATLASATYLKELVRPSLEDLAAAEGGLLLVVYDSTTVSRKRRLKELRPRSPYARRQAPIGRGQAMRTGAWAWYLPPEPDVPSLVAPAYRPGPTVTEREDTDTDDLLRATHRFRLPRWRHVSTLDWTFGSSLGAFPWRRVDYRCNTSFSELGSVPYCIDIDDGLTWTYQGDGDHKHYASQVSEGLSGDLYGLATVWMRSRPRVAIEGGLSVRLDVVPAGRTLAWPWVSKSRSSNSLESDLRYAWSWRPQAGPILGVRFAPPPSRLWLRGGPLSWPWGADRTDGISRLGRTQYGLRAGLTLGPGFNGMEYTLLNEAWMGRSLRSRRAPHHSFTPYQPVWLLGPYVQTQYGFRLGEAEQYLELRSSWAVVLGIRGQFRLKNGRPDLPEAK